MEEWIVEYTPIEVKSHLYVFAVSFLTLSHAGSYEQYCDLMEAVSFQEPETESQMASALVEIGHQLGIRVSHASAGRRNRAVEEAARKADLWIQGGLFLMKRREPAAGAGGEPCPAPRILYGVGDGFDARPGVAVLNSRKPTRIRRGERWVRVAVEMTRRAVHAGCSIVGSYGTLPYDLIMLEAARLQARAWIVCPDAWPFMRAEGLPPPPQVRSRLDLFPDRSTFVTPFPPRRRPPPHRLGFVRDQCVAGLACSLWMGEIRRGGNMERLGREILQRGGSMAVYVPAGFDPGTAGNAALLEEDRKGSIERVEIHLQEAPERSVSHNGGKPLPWAGKPEDEGDGCLIHFTRGYPGPWPGQSVREYLEEILTDSERMEHTPLDALIRILEEGRIRASRALIRCSRSVVCFTERTPGEILAHRFWRSSLRRWSLEPYGIAISRSILEARGCVPVIYGTREDYAKLPEEERFRFQVRRSSVSDWSWEQEWRLPGDLILDEIPTSAVRLVVPSVQEASLLIKRFGEAFRAY